MSLPKYLNNKIIIFKQNVLLIKIIRFINNDQYIKNLITMNTKHIIILLFVVFISKVSFSQIDKESFCHEIDNKNIIKEYDKAIGLLISRKYEESEKILNKILKEEEDFTEAIAALAEIQYIRYENALDGKKKDFYLQNYALLLEKIVIICPEFENYQLFFIIGKILYRDKKYEKSQKYLSTFITKITDGKFYEEAVVMIENMQTYNNIISKKVPYSPELIINVSSENDEYLPFISPDGSLLFFTRAYMKKDISSSYLTKYVEEFSISHSKNDSGIDFGQISAMPSPFNAGRNQGAATININNSILYMTICEFVSRDYNNCDIYQSTKTSNGWAALKNLGANVNGTFTWESQPSISADGKTLYFASIRSENIGFDPNNPTSDIYYSTLNSDGTWSKAKNLGPTINTAGNEKSPFIHSDSQTLYFSSDGHIGVGGYDIFFSKYRDEDWAIPQNIGFPINTENDDIGFVVNTSGTKAYFASNKLKGIGGWDIYSIDIYEEIKPEKVVLIKGEIFDEHGYGLSEAQIDFINVENNQISEGVINKNSGQYAVAIKPEKKEEEYLVVVKKKDYSFTSTLVDISENNTQETIQINFDVKPIEEGISVKLNDIYFATASYQIDKKSNIVLNNFIIFLNENPKVKIEIGGHTDNIGALQTNILLSQNRAKSVYDYLLKNGISKDRLQYKGFGPNNPVATNETEEGRAKNRRTEFFILEK